ncbi:hypothetical protein [Yoonia sp. 208BN28-4]|uniref:hypothetical protein n=1 Tax=Yoonia sp. 208BN28-4 TaxID=3126505 RepID=UPI0030A045CF
MMRKTALMLALGTLASQGQAQILGDLAPSFNACAQTHADREQYIATMLADGWTVTEDRDRAIARISDTFLPVIGPSGLPWDDMMTARAEAGNQPGVELVGDRDLYEQDRHIMMIGGYEMDDGQFRVDCWLALPDATLVDAVFESIDDQTILPQINMAAFAGPEHSDGSMTRMMVVQLDPETEPTPRLAGRNGLYIQTVIPPQAADGDDDSTD